MDEFDQRTDRNEAPPPILVPPDALSDQILMAVIESFVLREGTDYGREEVSLETKIKQVQGQLQSGKVKIVFDPGTESVTLMTDRDWKKLKGLA